MGKNRPSGDVSLPYVFSEKNLKSRLQKYHASLEDEIEYSMTDFASGKLVYTARNVRIVNSTADIPIDGDFRSSASLKFYFGDSGEKYDSSLDVSFRYPEICNGDGEFITGGYLILVDFSVRNDGAAMYTTNDLDSDGYPLGRFDDPYLFIPMVFLADMSKIDDEYYASLSFDYYSRMYEETEAYDSFHLEPGETLGFTLGWLVTDEQFDGLVDISSLALEFGAETAEECSVTYIELNLSPEVMQ